MPPQRNYLAFQRRDSGFLAHWITAAVRRYGLPSVITKLVTLTGWVAVMETVVRFKSLPLVPTLPSMTKAAVESTTLNQDAVPVALADESCVMADAVNTPLAAAADDGSLNVSSARRVVAAPPVAGRVPS